MSLSIDALTSALLGCHQSAHCAPEEMAPAVSGRRRLTERRRRRLVTTVKVSFLHPPPVCIATTSTDSHIMITTQPYTNHDSLIDWILSTARNSISQTLELSLSCVETGASVQPNICCVLGHPLTSLRHHPPAAAATTTSWLSFGFQRPHRPNFKLFWSAAAAAAGLGCLSRRVCAVKPKDVVNVFGRCRPVKTRRRLRV